MPPRPLSASPACQKNWRTYNLPQSHRTDDGGSLATSTWYGKCHPLMLLLALTGSPCSWTINCPPSKNKASPTCPPQASPTPRTQSTTTAHSNSRSSSSLYSSTSSSSPARCRGTPPTQKARFRICGRCLSTSTTSSTSTGPIRRESRPSP